MQRLSTLRQFNDRVRRDECVPTVPSYGAPRKPAIFAVARDGHRPAEISISEELAAMYAIAMIEGKWRAPILLKLLGGPIHFGELKRRLSPISKKVLNQHLRQMAADGLIVRTEYLGKMPRVEYSLANPLGHAVLELLQTMAEWEDRHRLR